MTCNCVREQLEEYRDILASRGIIARNLTINGAHLMLSNLKYEVIGSLSYDEEVTLKDGKVKTKARHIDFCFPYCPFCGKAYQLLEEEISWVPEVESE